MTEPDPTPLLAMPRTLAAIALPVLVASVCRPAPEAAAGTPPDSLGVPATPPGAARSEFDHSHAAWTDVLAQHVRGDAFAYAALKEDPSRLDAYLASLQRVTPQELADWTRDQRFAFWINAYNAYTIRKVISSYPLKSIRDLDKAFGLRTVFDQAWIPMPAFDPDGDGDALSLNDIEHEILRARFPDARLHAAINCASVSCPPLRGEAFVADRLDRQLDEQMRAFVRDPRRNRFDREAGRLRLSEIFKWFDEDFERDAGSVRAYVLRYAPEELADFAREAKIRYLDYDWDLNDVARDS